MDVRDEVAFPCMEDAIAHEIKNTVALALANIGLIALSDEHHIMEGYCEHLERALIRINTLAHLFTQPVAAQDGVPDLWEVLSGAVNEYRASWPGVTFQFTRPESALIYNNADGEQLRMVFTNLLKNAVEAAGPRGRVEITAQRSDDNAQVIIRDNGSGLDAFTAERLAQGCYTTKETGSGMGIAICRSIAARYGGSLEMSNNDHGGCEVSLSLPL